MVLMKNIEFVFFDVGGVLLLDYSGTDKWIEMKRDLGVTKDLDDSFDKIWKKYRQRICIDYDVDTIIPVFEKEVGIAFPENYSMLTDFVNRFEVNKTIWSVAKKAKDKYQVGLLTNMYPRMLPLIRNRDLIPDIAWDEVVDSSIVGYQKPEQGIFEVAEKMAKIEPSKIFFIDNSPKHLEGAKKRGWKTLLYDPQDPEQSSQRIIEALGLD